MFIIAILLYRPAALVPLPRSPETPSAAATPRPDRARSPASPSGRRAGSPGRRAGAEVPVPPGVPGEPGVLPGPTAPPPIRVHNLLISCKLIQDSEHKSEMSVCHLSLFECAVKVGGMGRQASEAEGAGVAEEANH